MNLQSGADDTTQQDFDQLWSMPSYLLNRISHRYSQNVHSELKSRGLTTLNLRIIVALKFRGELTVNELCVHAIAEQPAMSRALDRLETDGYVTRVVSESDSRVRIVQLLEPAVQLFDEMFPVMQSANQKMLSALSEQEREQLIGLLVKVLTSIRKSPV